jgi:ADP-heptose:LPS heptosyltransferase
MKILALQLKRIGDLILTTPALAAIKSALRDSHLTIGVHESTSSLLPALPQIDAAIVFGPGRGWTPWQQVLTGRFDAVLDFTGTDRSALATGLSRANTRATFSWVEKKAIRKLAYRQFIASAVRDRHTIDHYGDLCSVMADTGFTVPSAPVLALPSPPPPSPSRTVVVHPFTARPEKNWLPERWATVLQHCLTRGFDCLITGGASPGEQQHHAAILRSVDQLTRSSGEAKPRGKLTNLAGETDLLGLASTIATAHLVLSCDTAAVHFAAAFQRPQIALFGPTNPFHWRPRHGRAVVLSAAQPNTPLTDFQPRMRGAPMEHLSTELVIRVTDSLLSQEQQP